MNIGKRSIAKIFSSVFGFNHYRALWNMALYSQNFSGTFNRYFFNKGSYPFSLNIRTPTGQVEVTAYSYHDILTINEIFFRKDYFISEAKAKNITAIVDIGANIGISGLYFLSRNVQCKAYLFEPDDRNIKKLYGHLKNYKDRIKLEEKAVANYTGEAEFSIEESGRYGGLGRVFNEKMIVQCIDINEALKEILKDTALIDILKIDTEGMELIILNSIQDSILDRIDTIFYELDAGTTNESLNASIAKRFTIKKSGPVRVLQNQSRLTS